MYATVFELFPNFLLFLHFYINHFLLQEQLVIFLVVSKVIFFKFLEAKLGATFLSLVIFSL